MGYRGGGEGTGRSKVRSLRVERGLRFDLLILTETTRKAFVKGTGQRRLRGRVKY